jgi:hypothetical protein
MSVLVGKELNDQLHDYLKGDAIESKTGKAIIVATMDEGGWPHPAMLSCYEVVAKSRSVIDLAIGKTSTTAKNLRRTGKVTMLITDRGLNYYLKGDAREIRPSMDGVPFMSLFRIDVEQVLEDQEPDAMITSGVTFSRSENKQTEELIGRIFKGVRDEP